MTAYYVFAGRPQVSRWGAAVSHRCVGGFTRLASALRCAARHAVGRVWVQDQDGSIYAVQDDGVRHD